MHAAIRPEVNVMITACQIRNFTIFLRKLDDNSFYLFQYFGYVGHDCDYNSHFRQLLHVGFKVAAEMGERFLYALKANEAIVARNVTNNLLERHIMPLFS
jgi:hypothetical protein